MLKNIGVGKAHGKIILGGEHSVVYGMPALVLPMPLEVKVLARTMPLGLPLDMDSRQFPKTDSKIHPELEGYVQMVSFIKDKLDFDGALHIQIESEIPIQSGLGSSAAVANAIAESVIDLIIGNKSPLLKNEAVTLAERFAHGNPSGLDAIGTQAKMPILFQKKQVGNWSCAVEIQGTFHFVIALSGLYVSTKEVVEQVSAYFAKKTSNKALLLEGFSKVVNGMENSLLQGDALSLGHFMNENHKLLNTLGVSSKKLDEMVEMALKHGALGAKLSGKGIGGAVIALVKSKKDMAYLIDVFINNGILEVYPLVLKNEKGN